MHEELCTAGYFSRSASRGIHKTLPRTIYRHPVPVIPTVARYKNSSGRWIYDLGQNFSGIIRISVRSDESRTIRFRPAELLKNDSTPAQGASGEPFYFSYTAKGGGQTERWQPQFTYYGFRYDIGPNTPGYAQLTANGVTATAIYYYNATIMQREAGCG